MSEYIFRLRSILVLLVIAVLVESSFSQELEDKLATDVEEVSVYEKIRLKPDTVFDGD